MLRRASVVFLALAVLAAVSVGAWTAYARDAESHSCLGQLGKLSSGRSSVAPPTQQRVSTKVRPFTAYTLVPEPIDWAFWCKAFGNPTGAFSNPQPKVYAFGLPQNAPYARQTTITLDGRTGAVFAGFGGTGRVETVGSQEAYSYALSWLRTFGGLPSDAVLIPHPSYLVESTGFRSYGFGWREPFSMGLLFGNSISVTIDERDARPEVTGYTRIWRSVGAPLPSVPELGLRRLANWSFGKRLPVLGICAKQEDDSDNIAVPCDAYAKHYRHKYLGPTVRYSFLTQHSGELIGRYAVGAGTDELTTYRLYENRGVFSYQPSTGVVRMPCTNCVPEL